MFSSRVPGSFEPNRWSAALARLQADGTPLLDLTVTDPTAVGLGGVTELELAALAAVAAETHTPDPRGLASARVALAADLATRGAHVAVEDLVLTASTSEAYAHLFRLLCDPGEVVLVPSPGYPLFEPLAAAEAVRVAAYRVAWDGRWHLDVGSLDAAFAAHPGAVRAVVLVQPNLPTGTGFDADEIAAIEARCLAHDAAIVSDEVFREFGWPGRAPVPSLLGARAVPTFVLDGLSKSCGMPQLKLGWIALAGPEPTRRAARDGLEWISDLFLSVASPVQLALPALLAAGVAYRHRVHTRLEANRGALARFVTSFPAASVLAADAGWVAILRLPERFDAEHWALELLERRVLVHGGDLYDLAIPSCVVVSLLPEPSVFAAGLGRLGALMRG